MQARTCAAVKRESLRSAADAVRLVIDPWLCFVLEEMRQRVGDITNFDIVVAAVSKRYARTKIPDPIASDSGVEILGPSKNDFQDSRR